MPPHPPGLPCVCPPPATFFVYSPTLSGTAVLHYGVGSDSFALHDRFAGVGRGREGPLLPITSDIGPCPCSLPPAPHSDLALTLLTNSLCPLGESHLEDLVETAPLTLHVKGLLSPVANRPLKFLPLEGHCTL